MSMTGGDTKPEYHAFTQMAVNKRNLVTSIRIMAMVYMIYSPLVVPYTADPLSLFIVPSPFLNGWTASPGCKGQIYILAPPYREGNQPIGTSAKNKGIYSLLPTVLMLI